MSTRTTYVPAFVLENLDTLNFSTKGIDVKAVMKQSGLSRNAIVALIKGWAKPSIAPYNAIAEFLNWQKWEAQNVYNNLKGGDKT